METLASSILLPHLSREYFKMSQAEVIFLLTRMLPYLSLDQCVQFPDTEAPSVLKHAVEIKAPKPRGCAWLSGSLPTPYLAFLLLTAINHSSHYDITGG